ncbi:MULTISPECIES: sulfotransferase [Halanaerobium]|jgi:hypothetical protein|uniref:Sulfotransferase family protein n=1 Tax=Halanaerobium congolense TaxID=54121 RepID=A0A1M7JUG2_9FIRM|nr:MULTISPECIES: sulfotransferase [Halanaerobium]KXS47546.1 MAG: hypothetical protein AWL62_2591 [Halanaerobium sp. T82-1]OEG62723.1 MAG: hypothetical protein BHK79_06370 [Halanaerobium sp. MDAL1]PUU87351.1 MAG: hypothetical protein CI949_3605 [Halanaerobium sp.]PUU87615.1 MAG: hypothetical protein CI948_2564 [Halanaerobium sp.]TDS31539.1 sulfotransferase family protein [Halanaerobium congolense]
MLNYLRTIREYIKFLPAKLFNEHNKSDKKDVSIFSTPRSGSTWLMEIINSQDNFKYINEPLHTNRHKGYLTDIDANWSEIYSSSDRQDKFLKYFESILNDELFVGQQKFKDILNGKFDYKTNRRVFKILRAKDLINKFENEFDIKIVFLLRHPIPVALSLVREKMEDRVKHYLENEVYLKKFFNQEEIKYAEQLYQHGSEFEKRILQWCLENNPPLTSLNNKEWIVISYEDLVVNEEETLLKLYKQLDLNDLDKMFEQTKKPSRTTASKNSKKLINKRNKESIIKKWEKEISLSQKEKAFEILDKFNLDIYIKDKYTINKNSYFFNRGY